MSKSTKVKVLHVIDSLGLGGAQTFIKGLIEAVPMNQKLALVSLRDRQPSLAIESDLVYVCGSRKRYSLSAFFFLRQCVRYFSPRILHCHLFRSQVFGLMSAFFTKTRPRLIFHIHSCVSKDIKAYGYFLFLVAPYVDLFLTVSDAAASDLSAISADFEGKVLVMPNYVDCGRFNYTEEKRSEARKNHGFSKDDFVIGFSGRLAKIKGPEYLIRALPFLASDWKLLLLGSGPEESDMRKLISDMNLESRVVFAGYTDRPELFYPAMDVLVMPSLSEAAPMAFLEAQACGLPVLGSDLPVIRNFVTDGAWAKLFPIGNSQALADGIEELRAEIYSENKEAKMKQALAFASTYDLDSYLVKLNDIYATLE